MDECGSDRRGIGIIFKPDTRTRTVSLAPKPVPKLAPHRLCWLLAMLLAGGSVQAQTQDNRVVRSVLLDQDTVRLDSMSIVPGSFTLWKDTVRLPDDAYRLDPYHGTVIRTEHSPLRTDTLIARYRVMPLLLAGPFRHKDLARLQRPSGIRDDPFKYIPGEGSQSLLGGSELSKSGSISRGILFGNNQDLSVNSTMNLELNGKLTPTINVQASVTDNNVPIQAGGNTLETQDFDRVFIRLFDDRQELIAGDFVLERPKSWFLNYYKKTKGLSYSTKLGVEDGIHGTLGVSAAISKGEFSRNQIQGVEGVQGPYRLTASGGGAYIIILSGTERVYMDGQLLVRGMANDYVIDYNTAEVTFTTRRLVTKDRRIVVEFQYSDKNYARSLVNLTHGLQLGATTLRVDLYSEQDHKDQPLQQSLTSAEQEALSQAGDDPLAAVVPGADSVAFSANEVLYAQVDSLGWSPVYRYSTDPDSARYRVTFSNVGMGNGDYIQQEFTANGRVFLWIAPEIVNGVIQRKGDNAAVRVLVPPRSKRMLAIGADHRFSRRTKAWGEVALSEEDKNTFSDLDDADDQGIAVRAGASHLIPLAGADSSFHLTVGTDNEWRSSTFSVIERYRPVEFDRDWNLVGGTPSGDQVLSSAVLGLALGKQGNAALTGSLFHIEHAYDGFRQALKGDLHLGRFDVRTDGSLLHTSTPVLSTDFLRSRSNIAYKFNTFTMGVAGEQERNRSRNDSSALMVTGSYAYQDWEAFMQSPDSAKTRFRLSAGQRYDQAFSQGALTPTTEASNYSANLDVGGKRVRKLAATFTYRRLQILDSTLTSQSPEDTYLARLEHGHQAWKGAFTWDLFYEFGSGLEARSEFIYVQVPPGQGTYVWNDYNGDGIKDLNEFEQASFSYEADQIRVYVQTNETVRVLSDQMSASAELRPSVIWRETKGIRGFLGKWNDVASFRSDRKTGNEDVASVFNPFELDPSDTALIALNSSVRNTIYYDRSSRTWSMDHTYQSDRGKSLLLNGSESRLRENNILHMRWNTTQQWTAEAQFSTGRTVSASDMLLGRSYSIDERALAPKVTWQPNTRSRTILEFKYTGKSNSDELGGEQAELRDLGIEFRYNSTGKGALTVNANYVGITYDGTVDSSLGTEMLAGLKPGRNLTWSFSIQRRLSDHLQVDLTYNGRSSPGVPVVHVGGAQVRAFF